MISALRYKAILLAVVMCFIIPLAGMANAPIKPTSAEGLLNLVAENDKKIVVVNIFASWCPPCRDEIPDLVSFRKEVSENDILLVGISLDKHNPGESVDREPAELTKFAKDMGFNFPIFYATKGFEAALGLTAIPQLFVYKNGELVHSEIGSVTKEDLHDIIKSINK